MKMDIVAGSQNDEFYTPNYAIFPIIKYLKEGSIIWCPFDTEDSLFVKILKEKGFKVIQTHKDKGEDFFKYSFDNTPDCDYIISNPPYSLKTEVLKVLFEWGKPFAMLVGVVGLFESKKRFEMFKENDFEIMYFNKRIAYFKDFKEQIPSINPPFSSVYVCKNILPKQIVFEEVKKNIQQLNSEEAVSIPPNPKGIWQESKPCFNCHVNTLSPIIRDIRILRETLT